MRRSAWITLAVVIALIIAAAVYAHQARRPGSTLASILPAPATVEVPVGTVLDVRLETGLSTKTARVGDHFDAVVAAPVSVGGETAIPAGAAVTGHLIVAEQPGKIKGRGELELAYDRLRFDGRDYPLDSRSRLYESRSGKSKDIAMVGGGAAAGGLLGGLLGESAGAALKGVVVGGAAGTAASLLTRGPQLELGRGTTLEFRLDHPLQVRKPKGAA